MAIITKLQKQKKKKNALKDRWRTPTWLFRGIEQLLGREFTIDVACDETNALCDKYLTIKDNALLNDWGDKADFAWVNPPYAAGCIIAFVRKAIEQQRKGVSSALLVPVSTDTQWYVLAHQFCETYLVTGKRVQFELANVYEGELDDQKKSTNTGGSMILYFDGRKFNPNSGQIRSITYQKLHQLGAA